MHGELQLFWYEYFSPNVGITSVGLFVFFRYYFQDKNGKLPFIFEQINKGSLGVYILHYFLLGNFLYRIFPHVIAHFHPIIAIPIDVLITLIISLLITRSLQQLPIVKKIVP
jgi:hypothetical protein